jgi:hypothetical protein
MEETLFLHVFVSKWQTCGGPHATRLQKNDGSVCSTGLDPASFRIKHPEFTHRAHTYAVRPMPHMPCFSDLANFFSDKFYEKIFERKVMSYLA